MTLAHNLISVDDWISCREPYKLDTSNAELIKLFNSGIYSLASRYTGVLCYYKYVKSKPHNSSSILEYSESSPFARLFKVSPNGYYLYNYENIDLWKKAQVDTDILSKYLYHTNKYKQPATLYEPNISDYILFTLQANATFAKHSFNIRGLFDIVKWANNNKQHILFKLHPFTPENSHIHNTWRILQEHGYITQYTVLIGKEYNLDSLIDGSKAVWTFSSGSGFQAILKGKPVAHFFKDTDYQPIATFATSPEEASSSKVCDTDKLYQYLSWYYHKLTIDVTADNFIDRLDRRFHDVYKKGKTLDQIF